MNNTQAPIIYVNFSRKKWPDISVFLPGSQRYELLKQKKQLDKENHPVVLLLQCFQRRGLSLDFSLILIKWLAPLLKQKWRMSIALQVREEIEQQPITAIVQKELEFWRLSSPKLRKKLNLELQELRNQFYQDTVKDKEDNTDTEEIFEELWQYFLILVRAYRISQMFPISAWTKFKFNCLRLFWPKKWIKEISYGWSKLETS